jgi:Domain of unknown function (DUF4126)
VALGPDELAALVIVTSFAAGLNVYATVATLGLLARTGLLTLPGSLEVVSNWWVIGLCGALFVVEFFADKIPFVDLVWNALQTLVRVPVGGLLGFAATTTLDPVWQLVATIAGGAIALAAHGGKMAARAAVTSSPEPVTNIVLSAAEDVIAIGLTWFATRHPFIAAAIVVVLLAIIVAMIRSVIRVWRWMVAPPNVRAGSPRR